MPTNNPELATSNSLDMRLLTGAILAAALSPLGSTTIAVALPEIGRDFVVKEVTLTHWLAVSYLVVSLAGLAPGGRIADRMGHLPALVLGLSVYAGGAVLGLFGMTLPMLALARIIMAIGGAIAVPSAMALIRSRTSSRHRSWPYGVFSATMATAAALGPVIAGELIAQFGWRAIFAAGFPLMAISLLCLWKEIAVSGVRTERLPFDWPGSLLLGAGLGLVTTSGAVRTDDATWLWLPGGLLLILFVVRSFKSASPVIDPRIFARGGYVAGCLVIGAQNLAMYTLLFQLPILFARSGQVEPTEMGRTLLVMMAGMVLFSLAGGRIANWLGLRRTALLGAAAALGGWWQLGDPVRFAEPTDAMWGLLVLGCGIGFSMAPAQTASMEVLRPEMSGMAAGGVSMARYLGAIIGLAALSWLLADGTAHTSAMLLNGLALIVALIASLLLPARSQRCPEESV